jgi:hypothetical protein
MMQNWFERLLLPAIIVMGAGLGGLMVFALSLAKGGGSCGRGRGFPFPNYQP